MIEQLILEKLNGKINNRPSTILYYSVCQVYYCWSSPAHSCLVPSPTGVMAMFYCLTALGFGKTDSDSVLCSYREVFEGLLQIFQPVWLEEQLAPHPFGLETQSTSL
jgi:hypothetical protein